ncbi:hypothetical protein CP532_2333 [Ophiocordyceps camponoti-leonardi (nom. inval.)]|nr:hypothetical protein CP532_2333 [Ophiocordyceps camponoti-leonardi (nom. inval.)]
MWEPNFLLLHYAGIIFLALLALPILYPGGNMALIDAFFMGFSSATDAGLPSVDCSGLSLHQQLYIYLVPLVCNMGFVHVLVTAFHLRRLRGRLNRLVDNLGFTLTPDSMGHFRDASLPLLLLGTLGLAGQTLRPVFLRFSLWVCSRIFRGRDTRESASYLLENPQACLSIFPGVATRVQLMIIAALTVGETVFITAYDRDGVEVAGLSLGQRLSAAFFQAAAARHAGMTPYNLANVSAAVQLSLLVMMFIATCPIVTAEYDNSAAILASRNSPTYLLRLIREQLSLDVWWFFLGVFCLTVSEARSVQDDPVSFTPFHSLFHLRYEFWTYARREKKAFQIFPLMFEVVTAYNNVGISLGHPDVDAALCARFSVVGKLILCVIMVRGRHRRMIHRFRLLPERYLLRLEEEESCAVGGFC